MTDRGTNDERIQRALEGRLTSEQFDALRAEVLGDPSLRADYVEQLWLHATLAAERHALPQIFASASVPSKSISLHWRHVGWVAAVAASLIVVIGFRHAILRPRGDAVAAVLARADNCKWAGCELPTAVGSKLGPGRLALVEGIATLQFASGASVTIEAPTTFEILSPMHGRLIEGTLTADVPEPAHGFTVDTPDIQVVDLGTKFGLTTGSAGDSQVLVFDGEVEIEGRPDGKPKRLTAGRGLHVGSGNTAAGQEPTRGEPVQETGGWTSIPTSFGRGKDAFVRRGDVGAPLGLQPLILVKHSELAASVKNERRAVLTFDIGQTDVTRVVEAQLVLDPEPSGFGFSSLVPDSRFAVYGLLDSRLDDWDERSLRWSTLPGCTDQGPDPAATRKLAEFTIPRGGSGGPLTIASPELAEFIRDKTNGLASLLIVRETGETNPSGLAHGFASKEHPAARPPTLRLKEQR